MSGKKEVRATYPQLKGAFKQHGMIAATGTKSSHDLLRFYANECGLKALYIRENNLDNTGDFATNPGKKYGYEHDLIKWIDELKIPGFVLTFTDNPNDPLMNVHEKLRYGVDAQPAQMGFLNSLQALIKKHL